MADSTDELLKQLIRLMEKDKTEKGGSNDPIDSFKKSLENLDKMAIKNTTTWGGMLKQAIGYQKSVKDLTSKIEQLDEEIDELAEVTGEEAAERREELVKRRDTLKQIQTENESRKAAIASVVSFGGALSKGVGQAARAIGKMLSDIQSGADAFTIGGGLLTGMVDIAQTGVHAVSDSMSAAGNIMQNSTNKKLRVLGSVVGIVSPLIKGLGDAAAEATKFYIDFMVKEAQKLIEAFHKLSSSGAIFADGVTGMKDTAHAAGLTIKQLSEVIGKHAETIAQSGLGMAEGAKQMGRVATALKTSGMQDKLLNLGYTFEEQAELIAETTANMRRTAGGKASEAEIATQTAKYAENLRTIAAITGEDAKKKVAQAQEQNQLLAFQQELAKKTPEQRAQIDAAMATMTEIEKKNFRDRVLFGNVINQEGAIYESQVKGAREKMDAQVDLFNKNALTADSNAKINAQYGDQINESILANKGLAQAAYATGGVLTDVAKDMLDNVNQNNKYTKEAVEATKTALEGQKNATDGLTHVMVDAEKEGQRLAVKLESLAQNELPHFGEVINKVIAMVEKQLSDSDIGSGKDKKEKEDAQKGWWDKTKDWLSKPGNISGALKGSGAVTEAAGLVADATGVGAAVGVPLNIAGAVLTALGYGAEMIGFADGGISYGNPKNSDGSQLAKVSEGGIAEAHVPLPDGKTIPVNLNMGPDMMRTPMDFKLDMSDISQGFAPLNETMKKLSEMMEKHTTGMSGITTGVQAIDAVANLADMVSKQLDVQLDMANHAKDSKDLMQKLLNVSM